MIFGSVLLGGILVFSLYGLGNSIASSNYGRMDDDEHEYEGRSYLQKKSTNALYTQECASCHMAYPAGLLPAASWSALMNGLEDHFGENAEMDEAGRRDIENYLVETTSSLNRYNRKMLRNAQNQAPLRITGLPYFKHKHREIPTRLIKNNPQIGSLSQCNACHPKAEKGGFDEDDVIIPGVGPWDD